MVIHLSATGRFASASGVALAMDARSLAKTVQTREKVSLRQLRAAPGTFMGVEFHTSGTGSDQQVIETAKVSEIAAYFELLPEPQRLIVLGEAGGGKTVAAIQLVLDILKKRFSLNEAAQAEEPVPVRVNAAGWDGREDFTGWLTHCLAFDYGVHKRIGRKLVEEGIILPVIDGLEEMDTVSTGSTRARAVLDRLSETPWRHRPFVVLCRTAEFEALCRERSGSGLRGTTSISLQSFTVTQIVDYLAIYQHHIKSSHTGWTAAAEHLKRQPDGPLATALRTPWLLGLAAAAMEYDPQIGFQLADCHDPDSVQDLLFAAQISAAVTETDRRNGPYRTYSTKNVQTWMLSLARYLERRRETGIEGIAIRLDEIWGLAGSTRCRIIHGLTVACLVSLIGGLGYWFGTGQPPWPGMFTCLVFAGAVAFISWLLRQFDRDIEAERFAWRVPGRSRWRRGTAATLLGGLVGGLAAAMEFRHAAGIQGVVSVGLVAGLGTGLVVGHRTNHRDRLAVVVDERRLLRDDAVAATVVGGAVGLVVSLVSLQMITPVDGFVAGFRAGLTGGLMFGLVSALVFGLASGRHLVASLIFRLTGTFPPRTAVFLDWARECGLLRVTGMAYQFRHETYRQWIEHNRCGVTGS
jgi:uncharacterized membrane protein YsdA (DUF1294 family)